MGHEEVPGQRKERITDNKSLQDARLARLQLTSHNHRALCSEAKAEYDNFCMAVARARKAIHMTQVSWSPCIQSILLNSVQRHANSADCVGMWCACVHTRAKYGTVANQLHQIILSELQVSTGSGIHEKNTQKNYKTKELFRQFTGANIFASFALSL